MLTRLRALPEGLKILIVLEVSLILFGVLVRVLPVDSPADRCHSSGYADAAHILQPDGQTRRWLCYTLPSDDLKTPWRAAYLSDLDA